MRIETHSLEVYLNDHLAGATFGAELARQLEARVRHPDFQSEMSRLAEDIEADLDTLRDLMQRLGASANPGKQVAAWVAEKASRLKLSGVTSADDELGTFLGLEALSLGVEGKAALWTALRELRGRYPELRSVDLDGLLDRAQRQRALLESERIAIVTRSLTTSERQT